MDAEVERRVQLACDYVGFLWANQAPRCACWCFGIMISAVLISVMLRAAFLLLLCALCFVRFSLCFS